MSDFLLAMTLNGKQSTTKRRPISHPVINDYCSPSVEGPFFGHFSRRAQVKKGRIN